MSYFNGNKWCRKCPIYKELEYAGNNATYQEEKYCSSCWQIGEKHYNFRKITYNKGIPMEFWKFLLKENKFICINKV